MTWLSTISQILTSFNVFMHNTDKLNSHAFHLCEPTTKKVILEINKI